MARFPAFYQGLCLFTRLQGTFFIEPKPAEPSKHQYDYDSATVIGFLRQYGLIGDFKLNIEVNHATWYQHTFSTSLSGCRCRCPGAVSMPTGDYQNGWDADQFPNNVYELAEIRLSSSKPEACRAAALTLTLKRAAIPPTWKTSSTPISEAWTPFARALLLAHDVLEKSSYRKLRRNAMLLSIVNKARLLIGQLTLQQLADIAHQNGEPEQRRKTGVVREYHQPISLKYESPDCFQKTLPATIHAKSTWALLIHHAKRVGKKL